MTRDEPYLVVLGEQRIIDGLVRRRRAPRRRRHSRERAPQRRIHARAVRVGAIDGDQRRRVQPSARDGLGQRRVTRGESKDR